MAIKAFQPPDNVPVIRGDGTIHPRWTRFFARLTLNSNGGVDSLDEVTDSINAKALAAVSRLNGQLAGLHSYLFERPIQEKSSAYTLQEADAGVVADATGGAVLLTLPDARRVKGHVYWVQKSDSASSAVVVACQFGQLINGSATVSIDIERESAAFTSDGENWISGARSLPNDGVHYLHDEANNLLKILDGAGAEWCRFDMGQQVLEIVSVVADLETWAAHETGGDAEATWGDYETVGATPTEWGDLVT